MTDRELLENAAKAAGINVPEKNGPWFWLDDDGIHEDISGGGDGTKYRRWKPLTDDGDALRLAVKLWIHVQPDVRHCWASTFAVNATELTGDNACAATRRAIVRAAAEIGENMP